jgi:hypothetical protein
MGKASSAKKVARAARAGGRVSSGQPRGLLFPGVLVLIVVLGVSLIVYARNDRSSQDRGAVPQLGDHIHEAFAVNLCGEFLPDIPEFESPVGIHTHGDGVLHIHPFSELGVGPNATLGRFFQDAREGGKLDLSISASKFEFGGSTYEEGKTKCKGVERSQLRVAYWSNVGDEASKPVVTTGGFNDLRLDTDGGGFTIFFGDPKSDIPRPPSGSNLAQLGAADGGQTPDSEGSTTTTAASEPPGSTSTTATSGETTTTAAK